jgi:hypothetical protein
MGIEEMDENKSFIADLKLDFDPDAKQTDVPPGDPTGKSLNELFHELFAALGIAE